MKSIYSDPPAPGVLRVFLCHSSTDKPAVRSLYERLQSIGVDPWLDEVDILPGQDWDLEIRKAIRACHIVLVCISKSSTAKVGYIQKEIRYVLDVADEQPDGTIFLIPVRLEECDVPERLRRLQRVDLYEQYGYQRLILALNTQAQRLGLPLFSDVEERATRTSLTPVEHGELLLKARYNWTLDSIIWALPGQPAREDEQIITASNLVGNLDAQRRLEELLAKRNGVKIGADSIGEQRPFSELHLIATGRHDSPVLTKEKPGCWTGRRAFAQVRPSQNIQLLPYPLVLRGCELMSSSVSGPYQGPSSLGHRKAPVITYRLDSTSTLLRLSRKP